MSENFGPDLLDEVIDGGGDAFDFAGALAEHGARCVSFLSGTDPEDMAAWKAGEEEGE